MGNSILAVARGRAEGDTRGRDELEIIVSVDSAAISMAVLENSRLRHHRLVSNYVATRGPAKEFSRFDENSVSYNEQLFAGIVVDNSRRKFDEKLDNNYLEFAWSSAKLNSALEASIISISGKTNIFVRSPSSLVAAVNQASSKHSDIHAMTFFRNIAYHPPENKHARRNSTKTKWHKYIRFHNTSQLRSSLYLKKKPIDM